MAASALAAETVTDAPVAIVELGSDCFAITSPGEATTGVIVGPDGVVVIDAQGTPARSARTAEALRRITDRPVRQLLLTHYHADSTLGAPAFGASEISASALTRGLILERGRASRERDQRRRGGDVHDGAMPRMVWPSATFGSSLSVWLGQREIRMMHLGRGHTLGDVVVWLPDARTMFVGDLVAHDVFPDAWDAYFQHWTQTLERIAGFRPAVVVPGHGETLPTAEAVSDGIGRTRARVAAIAAAASAAAEAGEPWTAAHQRAAESLAAAEPALVESEGWQDALAAAASRAFAEAKGQEMPLLWSYEREQALVLERSML
ncbi:MBL fold metallo-hydrolase [Segnochrobactrum spirostomi]|nr:MBL fold metallo-hydrolase [Segnochrobactrum spirostomi]